MPTKLDQDQISGLSDELSSLDSIDESLETKILPEDSINDQIDVDLQGQINNLKTTMLSLVFENKLNVMINGSDLFAITPTEFAIPVISTTWDWHLNTEIISGETSSFYRPMITGNYKTSVNYITNLGQYVLESDSTFFEVSK
jgi:hypothetical protein